MVTDMKLSNTNILDTGQMSAKSNESKDSSNVDTNTGKRMSVSLSSDIAHLLAFLATSQGITQNEALRKAIATEGYLQKEIAQGTKVLLQKPDGEIREVIFR